MKQPFLSRIARTAVVALALLGPGTSAAAQSARTTLATICAAKTSEPACVGRDKLSEDQAWLVVSAACRRASSPDATCNPFRKASRMVLTLDAEAGTWMASYEGKALTDIKFDVAGTPTLRLKPKLAEPMKIVVTNISPLVYSASPGTPKEDDLEVIAGLKTFLSLAGTGIQALVQTAAFSATTAAIPRSVSLDEQLRAVRREAERQGTPLLSACDSLSPVVTEFASRTTNRAALLLALNRSMQRLDAELGVIDKAKHAFLQTISKAERGQQVKASDLKAVPDTGLNAAYSALDNAAKALVKDSGDIEPCVPMLAAYSMLLGAPADATVVKAMAGNVDRNVAACSNTLLVAEVKNNLDLLRKDCPGKLEATLKVHAAALKPLVDRLMNATQVEEKVWQAVAKASETRNDVVEGLAVLNRELTRGRLHTWDDELVRELVVTRQNPTLPWNKVQTHSIVLKPDTPYLKAVTLAHGAETTFPYKLESATGRILGYGIGMIYTPLQESSWTAGSVPGSTDKVITESKRETRAGSLAAFLSYRFLEHRPATRHVQPTVDFGVALSSDHPGLFLGGGLELWRVGRIGIGWGPQRVTVLDEGQTVNVTKVSSNDDIRTVKRFDTSTWYISFSFALDSLSLFNKQ